MTNYRVGKSMIINPQILKQLIVEELTKSEVKDIVAKEVSKQLASRDTKRIIEDELAKLLGKTAAKDEIAEIAKKVLKRLYKDMAISHPYMIDRIKV
tara:strand:- start:88 stop:378 length:291 start_codon:yes stop_codon:yes gene_type:complete